MPIRAIPAEPGADGNTPQLQALVVRPTAHPVSWAVREPEARLDITVTPTDDGKGWNLMDLLGRPMGRITEASAKQFTICRFRDFTGRHSDQKPDAIPRINRTRFRLNTGQF